MAPSVKQTGEPLAENRPDREALTQEVAGLMVGGTVLMSRDLAMLMINHGFSWRTAPSYSRQLLELYSFDHDLRLQGVEIEKVIYRGKRLYYNGSLDLETETNISEMRTRIDTAIEAARPSRRAGMGSL